MSGSSTTVPLPVSRSTLSSSTFFSTSLKNTLFAPCKLLSLTIFVSDTISCMMFGSFSCLTLSSFLSGSVPPSGAISCSAFILSAYSASLGLISAMPNSIDWPAASNGTASSFFALLFPDFFWIPTTFDTFCKTGSSLASHDSSL